MKNKFVEKIGKNKIIEWLAISLIIIVCGLVSRFVLKEYVSSEYYKLASAGLLALGFLIFYPLLTKFFLKKGK